MTKQEIQDRAGPVEQEIKAAQQSIADILSAVCHNKHCLEKDSCLNTDHCHKKLLAFWKETENVSFMHEPLLATTNDWLEQTTDVVVLLKCLAATPSETLRDLIRQRIESLTGLKRQQLGALISGAKPKK